MPVEASSSSSPHVSAAVLSAAVAAWSSSGGADSSGLAASVEILKSLAKQREGEIATLRQQLRGVEASRDSLAHELTSSTNKLAKAETSSKRIVEMEAQLKMVTARHGMALEIIGEKDEELQDMQADLQLVKQKFGQQTDELLTRLKKYENGMPRLPAATPVKKLSSQK